MRLLSAAAALVALVLLEAALAADPVRLDLTGVEEQPGRLSMTLSAAGSDGRPLTDLVADNFRVTLNDAPAAIASVQTSAAARLPASVLLLVDVSGSMQGEPINQARRAMQEFIAGLDAADQVSIIAFDTRVNLVQDFTANRPQLDQAIGRLAAVGDTALYDAVIEGTRKLSAAPAGRRLIVLLSDGQSTVGLDRRGASLDAARSSGVSFVALGLGSGIDRAYLTDLAKASSGRLLEAPTPASLRQAYVDLAATIRSQYTVAVNVPTSLDRSQTARLSVFLSVRAGSTRVDRDLPPLQGAAPPPFDLAVSGFGAGQRLSGPVTVQPNPVPGVSFSSVEYSVDGKVVQTANGEPFSYQFDPAGLSDGSHLFRVVAVDPKGRRGEAQMPFRVAVAATAGGGSSVSPQTLVFLIAGALIAAGLVVLWLHNKRASVPTYERVKPWASRATEVSAARKIEDWPERPVAPLPPPPAEDPLLGRVIIMDEGVMSSGRFDTIREYEMRSHPLTFGTGSGCDIRVEDDSGAIAAEEARIWTQKGRLVYHKLTTLSALATEGVTSGWQILESGEDMRIGRYRLVFQAEAPPQPDAPTEAPPPQSQEHGMALRELWTRLPEDPSPL